MERIIAETQVCIVGGGVMGLATAWQLAARGLDVVIVEKAIPGLQASAANAGTLAIQNKHTRSIPLVQRAIAMWRTLSDQTGVDIGYEKRGGFRLAHSVDDLEKLERAVGIQRTLGVAAEMVYQPQLAREAPYLAPTVVAASYCPDDGMANPLASSRALLVAARREGARLLHHCPVSAIESGADDRFLVQTPRGVIRCAQVISAAGAWNVDVARMVGVELPLTTDVLQVMTTDAAPPLFPHIVTHVRGNLTVKQASATGKILIGGGWRGEGDPVTGIKRVCRETLIANLKWATQCVPGIAKSRLLRAWAGFEGRTPDKLLLSGSVDVPRGFHLLGCGGGGYTLAPFAGAIAAARVCGETIDLPLDAFNVKRFIPARTTTAS